MSVSFCSGCEESHDDFNWRHTTIEFEDGPVTGWFCTQWHTPRRGMTNKQVLEYSYTPFWQIAGLKPTREELAYDRQLKREGKTYYEKKLDELARAKVKYDTTKLKKEVMSGKSKSKPPVKYSKSSTPPTI